MTKKFAREKYLVERLVQRLGFAVEDYEDPNASGPETGADEKNIYASNLT
jgi:hypothetical protein